MATTIPLRNIWLLFLYAADLVRFKDEASVEAEAARDLPELLARLLVRVVQQRLRRNLSRGYQARHAVLSRVRGRIDVLATVSGQLLEQGRVACRFEEHTMDTPRNRLVRAALDYLSTMMDAPEKVHECRALSQTLGRLGVSSQKPSRAALATDQVSRNEAADLLMVSLAKMVFEAVIPSEQVGSTYAVAADGDVHLVRRLFEKAVANALRIQLQPLGWQVRHGQQAELACGTGIEWYCRAFARHADRYRTGASRPKAQDSDRHQVHAHLYEFSVQVRGAAQRLSVPAICLLTHPRGEVEFARHRAQRRYAATSSVWTDFGCLRRYTRASHAV